VDFIDLIANEFGVCNTNPNCEGFNGYDGTDTYNADEEFAKAIKANSEYVKNETLSVELIKDETLEKDLTLNDYSVGIKLERK